MIRTAGGIAESIGGVSDHVHLLIGLRATHRQTVRVVFMILAFVLLCLPLWQLLVLPRI